jgi:ubiquinone/menaquinone biosynthesis C-methylase UbiE
MNINFKDHWERIYATKKSNEVSWTQETPVTSLNFLHSFDLSKDAAIIDVGGGESRLVDFLVDEGYRDITVLDISAHALQRAKNRLGAKAGQVTWIEADITAFQPERKYDVWHDRATFHFLTEESQISRYVDLVSRYLKNNGYMTIGTFSDLGPSQCSGLTIRKYSEQTLHSVLKNHFQKIRCIVEDHLTPFHTLQNFLFCSFKKVA